MGVLLPWQTCILYTLMDYLLALWCVAIQCYVGSGFNRSRQHGFTTICWMATTEVGSKDSILLQIQVGVGGEGGGASPQTI